jgi:SAM-dependent methyltransferase
MSPAPKPDRSGGGEWGIGSRPDLCVEPGVEPCVEPCLEPGVWPCLEPLADRPSGAPNFDRLAGIYGLMERASFGPWLGRCRCAFLDDLAACRRALVLGDGDGRFTARLLEANAVVQIDAIDASPAMLRALLRRAGPHAGRVHAEVADARLWQPETAQSEAGRGQNPPYDLVVTHFFLDCLTTAEAHSLAAALRPALAPSARWVVSEFAVPEGWFGLLVARPVVWGLYCAFGWLTGLKVRRLPDHAGALGACGFTLEMRRSWLWGLLISEVWRANRSD